MGKPRSWRVLGVMLAAGMLAVACSSTQVCQIKNARLEVGDKAPDFRLEDHTGGFISLSDYRGKMNVVLAFYPLAWTPV